MKQRIAVIGAGPMGLAVAYQLSKEGYQPVLFEKSNCIGGMTACFDFDGLNIERYYHFHCLSDHALFEMLDELGLSGQMRWVKTTMGFWYQNRLQPWGNPVALIKFKGLGFFTKFRYGLHVFLSTKRNNWKPLDKVKANDWILRWVGEDAYKILWQKLFDYKFYKYATNLSAAWIWSRIRRIGRSGYDLSQKNLGYLEGGSGVLLKAMQDAIESQGGSILLNSPVTKVIIESGKVFGVEVCGRIKKFDKVVSTVPLPYVPKIIPDLPENILSKFKSIDNIAVVCVIAKLRSSVTQNFWLNINDPEMDIPGLVEYTNLRPLDKHIVYVPFYIPGEHPKYAETDQVFINKVKRFIKKINSNFSDNDFINVKVNRYRYAQPICNPGYLKKLPPVSLPVQGLWVADTSYYYPVDRGISESIDLGRKLAAFVAIAKKTNY